MSDNAATYENHIPEAVRRASLLADELAREAGAVDPSDEPGDPTPPVVEPVVPSIVPPAAPSVDWEQRYNTLQGKYDSEVPQLRGENQSLRHLIAEMQTPAPTPVVPAKTTTTVVVPPEDVETFGEDLVTAARRWARMEVAHDIEDLRGEIHQLRGGHQQIKSETTQSRNEAAFDADPELGGVWRQMNFDPKFLAWLAQVDPFAGVPRQGLLNEAATSGDTVRCMRFFKTYLAEHTAVSQPSPAPATQTLPTPEVAGARPTLEDLAAPGRSSGGSPAGNGGAPAEKRVWTRAEITRFYRDASQGKYAHREAEKQRVENDILAAATEGRIRN